MNNTSFRDPAGFVFELNGKFYRQINNIAKEDYDLLINSGLYKFLTDKKLLISHEEVDISPQTIDCYKVIEPFQINFITYPYEWCFSQLKEAALLTLKIQKEALKYGLSLKDASSYNVQFINSKPIFIDTLSFEKYEENVPWVAYNQFCKHFLAPLLLMSLKDLSLNQLLITNIDGIPLDLCAKLLPAKSKLNFGIFTHIVAHSFSQKAFEADEKAITKTGKMTRLAQEALIDSLKSLISSLKFPKTKTEWGDYYNNTNYNDVSFKEKSIIISDFLDKTETKTLCDLGANRGDFSRIASEKGIETLSLDIDHNAVEANYLKIIKDKETKILPLLQDLTNPSPNIGFSNQERKSFSERFKCDTVFALALIHHLSISNNLPFENTAKFFSDLCNNLIIEFVPKEDSKVQTLLSTRKDIFPNYTKEKFEEIYSKYFDIIEKQEIKDSKRTLYLMRNKQ